MPNPDAKHFNPSDRGPFEQKHKDVLLELVLVWGTLDSRLGQLLVCVLDISPALAAKMLAKMGTSKRFAEIIRRLRVNASGVAASIKMRRYKKTYEKFSKLRNRVAHSHCGGVWTKHPDYLIFTVFEEYSKGLPLVELVPISEMQRAIQWGRAFIKMAGDIIRLVEAHEAAS